jgi:alpha-tubulin suppressor-like RCC1 family protein
VTSAIETATPEAAGPAMTVIPTNAFAVMEGGSAHACGLTSAGQAWCWGRNAHGQLGDSTAAPTLVPVATLHPTGVTFDSITGGGGHTCALTSAGQAYCWGHNADGRLGDSTYVLPLMPSAVLPLGGIAFDQLDAGDTHTCGLDGSGQGYCWGGNTYGQIGDSTRLNSRISPTAVHQDPGVTFSIIRGGHSHSCALTGAGQAYCWGYDGDGAIGNGSPLVAYEPSAVTHPSGVTFVTIAAYKQSCALDGSGQAYCWGENGFGQVGDSTIVDKNVPVAVMQPSGVTFDAISAGGDFTCALDGSGNAWCWGGDAYGQLGNGTGGASRIPVAVTMPTGVTFTSISADVTKACALDTNGQSWCWGRNISNWNQIGDGTNTNRDVPTAVSH